MKLPNLRAYTTQANLGAISGLVGCVLLLMLTYGVFRGFKREHMTVLYNPEGTLGQFRPFLVFGLTAACLVIGGIAALLGFNSLGQKRNSAKGRSWLGLALGVLVFALAPVLLYAWKTLSDRLI